MSPEPEDQIPDQEIPDQEIPEQEITVTDNPDSSRYELRVGGRLAAFVTYRLAPGRIVLIHTETLDEFTGHGVGARLVTSVLDDARERGLQVVPRCPFVARYIAEHPEYQDLVAGSPRN